jgi:hypothetical protein
MKHLILSSFILLLVTDHFSCKHFTLTYNGFNYTYAGHDETGTYNQALDWCTRMGGHLPSIHSQNDIDFLINDLILDSQEQKSQNDTFSSMWLGARRIADAWMWNDASPFDFQMQIDRPPNNDYGLILVISSENEEENNAIQIAAFADPTERHMVCRLTGAASQSLDQLMNQISQEQETQRLALYKKLTAKVANMTEYIVHDTMQADAASASAVSLSDYPDGRISRLDQWMIVLTIFVLFNTILVIFMLIHIRRERRNNRR